MIEVYQEAGSSLCSHPFHARVNMLVPLCDQASFKKTSSQRLAAAVTARLWSETACPTEYGQWQ